MKVSIVDYDDYKDEKTKHKFIKEFTKGLKELGFVILKNHPIDNELIKKSYEEIEKFFLKEESYKKQFINKEIMQSGYIPFGIEKAKDSNKYDLKEFWQIVNDFDTKDAPVKNIWTDDEVFNKTVKKLYKEMYSLSKVLLEAFSSGVSMEDTYFKDITKNMNSVLRMIHYPPLDGDSSKKGHVRAAAHEDINLLTIMPGASETGLEILTDEGWLPIEANYDYLIVDTGDMLSRITNDEYKATTHRVVNPSDKNNRRFSMPFFCHPNPKSTLKCIKSCVGDGEKYQPINANDLLNERLKEINLKK